MSSTSLPPPGSHESPPLSSSAPTLAEALWSHRNQLNAIRLALALFVLLFHAAPLGGYQEYLKIPGLKSDTGLGTFAVGGFFALSGMLVTMSARRQTVGGYLRSRVLRILPAYLVVIMLSAFALAPIVYLITNGTLSGFYSLSVDGPFSYVIHNATFSASTLRYTIFNVFQGTTPFGLKTGEGAINGSLWTIPIELRCYVVALILVVIGRRLGTHWPILGAVVILGIAIIAERSGGGSLAIVQGLNPEYIRYNRFPLVFVFLCGALAGSLAERIRLTPIFCIAVVGLFGVTLIVGGLVLATIGFGLMCVVLPILARVLPANGTTIFQHDLSYGTYLWAFPVQQTLAFCGLVAIPTLFVGTSVVVTLMIAAASWFLVERPMLKLKQR